MTDRRGWETPGVEEVSPGVVRIPLPLPNDRLRAVNVYAIRGPNGIGLVDSGWYCSEGLAALRRSLSELGASPEDINVVLATHFHRDHYTLAVELQRSSGCRIALGAGERPTIDAIMAGKHALDAFEPLMARAGVPRSLRHLQMQPEDASKQYAHPTWWIQDGDRPEVGGRTVEALSTPGHTQGHFCFADDANGLLFAGDHVLPHITPSIGFETVPSHLPLADFLDSLRRVRARPDARLLPAHGPVTPSVHARVDELFSHHDERLRRCGDAVAAGAGTAYAVAELLPWTRRNLSLRELMPFDQILAVRETAAHLDVLCVQKRLAAVEVDGVVRYTLP